MINVIWASYHKETPNRGYWDQNFLEEVFAGKVWKTPGGLEFVSHEDFASVDGGAVVVIPAQYHTAQSDIDKINADIAKLPWCLFIVAGDERSIFPVENLKHDNMKIWLMTPNPNKEYTNVDYFIGEGYPQGTREAIAGEYEEKTKSFFFSGQITHSRREQMVGTLKNTRGGLLNTTPGFSQGMEREEYMENMKKACVIPAPSGPATCDSFRFFEALEAGCVPIADTKTQHDTEPTKYWNMLFGESLQFPTVDDWAEAQKIIRKTREFWPEWGNPTFAWWQQYKRDFVYRLEDTIHELAGTERSMSEDDNITVLVPTSPIPSHPDTRIIDETIESIRANLPNAEIIIMIDGVRKQQLDRKPDYEKYINKLLWKCNHEWSNVLPIVYEKHMHQVAMTRDTLKRVKTSLIVFVEHDTPITTDCEIPWLKLKTMALRGDADLIRFHYEAAIPKEHTHLMLDKEPKEVDGVHLLRTMQWSQRPHIARVDYYSRMLEEYFSENALSMIEDRLHGAVIDEHGIMGEKKAWERNKIWIFHPMDGNIKRSLHTDGREGDSKYMMRF